jgi:hypothetical protein
MIGIRSHRIVFMMVCTLFAIEAFGQTLRQSQLVLPDESSSGTVPNDRSDLGVDLSRVIRFSGITDAVSRRGSQTVGMTFALYGSNGETLWMETQNVAVDDQGHYSVLLGSQSTAGMPPDLFRSGAARMVGVRVENTGEQLLVLGSSPYAVSAQNANELGGRPAGEFVSRSELRDEVSVALKDLANLTVANGGRFAASSGVNPTASGGNGNGNGTPANPNAEILDAIAAVKAVSDTTKANVDIIKTNVSLILAKLNEPEHPVEFKVCAEGGAEAELGSKEEAKVEGEVQGTVGAEAMANGASAKARVKPSGGLKFEIKGAGAAKLEFCWDILATIRNQQAKSQASSIAAMSALTQSSTNASTLADAVARLDQTILQEKLATLASQLQMNPDGILNALDTIGNLSPGNGPFAALEAGGHFVQLGNILPLPPQMRTALQKPGDLFDIFKDIRTKGICHVSMPDVVRQALDPICDLANSDLAQLLNRVDSVTAGIKTGVGDVKKVVDSIEGVVDNIKGALPDAGDCKFFCK